MYFTYIIPYCTTEHHCSASAAPPRQENRQRARDQAPPGRLPAKKVERVVENRGVAGDAATHDASRLQRPPKFPISVNSRSADFFFFFLLSFRNSSSRGAARRGIRREVGPGPPKRGRATPVHRPLRVATLYLLCPVHVLRLDSSDVSAGGSPGRDVRWTGASAARGSRGLGGEVIGDGGTAQSEPQKLRRRIPGPCFTTADPEKLPGLVLQFPLSRIFIVQVTICIWIPNKKSFPVETGSCNVTTKWKALPADSTFRFAQHTIKSSRGSRLCDTSEPGPTCLAPPPLP